MAKEPYKAGGSQEGPSAAEGRGRGATKAVDAVNAPGIILAAATCAVACMLCCMKMKFIQE